MRRITVCVAFTALLLNFEASATPPSAEVAKKCVHFSYLAYPYARPGKTIASGNRQAYFKTCIEKDGDVPEPTKQNQ